jgi:hypothetical protein
VLDTVGQRPHTVVPSITAFEFFGDYETSCDYACNYENGEYEALGKLCVATKLANMFNNPLAKKIDAQDIGLAVDIAEALFNTCIRWDYTDCDSETVVIHVPGPHRDDNLSAEHVDADSLNRLVAPHSVFRKLLQQEGWAWKKKYQGFEHGLRMPRGSSDNLHWADVWAKPNDIGNVDEA